MNLGGWLCELSQVVSLQPRKEANEGLAVGEMTAAISVPRGVQSTKVVLLLNLIVKWRERFLLTSLWQSWPVGNGATRW
jgi:hypothetical protein